MELAEVIRRRRMVRNYDPGRPVPPEVVERLLGYAVHAPSAGFSQGWEFLVLDSPADRELFWDATLPPEMKDESQWLGGMRRAPLIVVPHSHRDAYLDRYAEPDKGWTDRDEARWPVPYWHIDTGMASLLILLGAVDEGLGACFFGIPPEQTAAYRAAFTVPARYVPIGAITIGYRATDRLSPSLKRGRRGADTVTHRGRWGASLSPPSE
jgi:nitroreductase